MEKLFIALSRSYPLGKYSSHLIVYDKEEQKLCLVVLDPYSVETKVHFQEEELDDLNPFLKRIHVLVQKNRYHSA